MAAVIEEQRLKLDTDDDLRRISREVLEFSVPHKLYRLAVKSTKAKSDFINSQVGLSMGEWKVLLLVGSYSPLSTKEVSERSTLDKTKVSRISTALMTAGLVSMDRDMEDRRKLDLKLTRRGQDKFKKLVRCLQVWDARLMAGLSPPDVQSFSDALRKLDGQLEIMRDQHNELAQSL